MKEQIIKKFLKYVSYDTQSDESSNTVPSTLKQRKLGEELVKQLHALGIANAYLDEYGYVYGYLPSNTESDMTIGLIAHQDTATEITGKDVKPNVIDAYDGSIIKLDNGLVIDPSEFPELKKKINHTIITTDGTTLLGADDKAGVAIIMQTVENLLKNNNPHPNIIITFTVDEEIGRGTLHFNYEYYKEKNCTFAYTIDGSVSNEIEFENFNAASAHVTIVGKSIHPGSAKAKMVNSIKIAEEFDSLLPKGMVPELTEGYEGFNHLLEIHGNCNETTMDYIIRNHNKELFNNQKQMFKDIEEFLNKKYPNRVTVEIKDSYYNMRELILEHEKVLEFPVKAMNRLKMNPSFIAIRGGTDGASLTYNGVYTPNLGTGAYNYHGALEYCDVNEMIAMVNVIIEMLKICTEE